MIYLGADHRGFELKEKIKQWLAEWARLAEDGESRREYEYEDLGNTVYDSEDDYVDFAKEVGTRLRPGGRGYGEARGILICGTGIGMDMVANKFAGVRCGLGFFVEQVKRGREEDDINCLALPADFITNEEAKEMIKVFLETEFLGREKYKRRVGKIERSAN